MSCCEPSEKGTRVCPSCNRPGVTVKQITMTSSVKPLLLDKIENSKQYAFCETPECLVVYFNLESDQTFNKTDLIKKVTIKSETPDTPLCYCYNIFKEDALAEIEKTGKTEVIKMVQDKMKSAQTCFCEKSNPRGSCCLKDIANWLKLKESEKNRGV